MSRYDKLCEFIIKNVGGKENISGVTHCMTRLRFLLADINKVNEKELLKNSEIVTAQKSGGKYQVVIGTHVGDVCEVLLGKLNLENQEEEPEKKEKKKLIYRMVDVITTVVTPTMGIMTACGLVQGVLAILNVTGIVGAEDGAYYILNALGQSIFYFFPIILGYTSAKAFKMDPFVGMLLGATMVMPELLPALTTGDPIYTVFSGTIFESSIYKTFLGIPVMFPVQGYTYSVIPVIFATYFASKLEHKLKNIMHPLLQHDMIPFINLIVSVPVTMLLVGPVINVLCEAISNSVTRLYNFSPMLTSFIVSAIYQPAVILGLHWPILTLNLQNLAAYGHDYLQSMMITASFAQMAVVFAVFLKTKSKKRKSMAVPALISDAFCIIEPSIYGFTLPVVKRFIYCMIGGVAGSLILTAFSCDMYAYTWGIFAFIGFINPADGSLWPVLISIVAIGVTVLISFGLTYFTYSEDPADFEEIEELKDKSKKKTGERRLIRNVSIFSPLKGIMKPLEKSANVSFAEGQLGKGVVIEPMDGKIYAPVDGTLSVVFPTKHAIGITSEEGIDVLIHIGIDTVELNGEGFTVLKNQGDKVTKGELLLEFDLDMIKAKGYNTETIVAVSNSADYLDILEADTEKIAPEELLLTVIPYQKEKSML